MFIVFTGSSTRTPSRSVASQVFAVLGGVVVLVVGLSLALAWWQAVRHVEDAAADRVTDIATTLASTDDVRDGVLAEDPPAALGAFIERERRSTGTDFITVMSPDGVRYTHPNPDQVGKRFVGNIADAEAGGTIVEQYTGTLGPSTRAVVPVVIDGEVRALVSVGILRTQVSRQLAAELPQILLPGLGAAVLSGAGAWLVAQRVRSQTLGLNAQELRWLHDHHEAVLHAVREGLVITDGDGRVQVVNDEARRLLVLGPDAVGRHSAELGLSPDLAALLAGGLRQVDVPHASGGRVLLVSSDEVVRRGRRVGTVSTLRDRTELESVTGQLSATRSLADALHAQAHEAANRLHTVVTLIEVGRADEAVAFATDELRTSQRQADAVMRAIEEPAAAALLVGKMSQAHERGLPLELDPDAHLPGGLVPARELVTILGNLLDNALDAVGDLPEQAERSVVVDAQLVGDNVVLTVSDSGPGMAASDWALAFERGWTTKPADGPAGRGIGLALVRQTVDLLGGRLDVSEPPGATVTVALPLRRAGGGDA